MLSLLLLAPCASLAGQIETGTLGGGANVGSADKSYKLDVVLMRQTSRLDTISMWLDYLCDDPLENCNGDDELWWMVYAEGPANTWNLVWNSDLLPTGATGEFVSSPQVDVELAAGTRYAVGVQFNQGDYDYLFEDTNQDHGWGVFQGSVWTTSDDWDPEVLGFDDPIGNFPPDTHGYLMEIVVEVLDVDADGVTEDTDCDDNDPNNFPGNLEFCDGLDNDCTGIAEDDDFVDHFPDTDLDGFGDDGGAISVCDGSVPPDTILVGGDCNDGDAGIFPGAVELCDTIDNDCSGTADDNLVYVDYYADTDGDGFGDLGALNSVCDGTVPVDHVLNSLDCDDTDADTFPMAPEFCDGLDNDCDGTIDDNVIEVTVFADLDGDGFGDPLNEVTFCDGVQPPDTSLTAGDCDDTSADTYLGAPELCDLLDNNCDGTADEGLVVVTVFPDADQDGFGDGNAPVVTCQGEEPPGTIADDTDCDDDNADRFPGNPELCDGLDNDCDTLAGGEDDFDGDGFLDCEDCAADDPTTYPGAPEVCDGVDHDCDGVIPERLDCDPAPSEDILVDAGCGGCDSRGLAGGPLWLLLAPLWLRRRRRGYAAGDGSPPR